MNSKIRILFTTVFLMTTAVFAQERLQVAAPGQIIANPDMYEGKVIALHGVIDKISLEHGTFTIIDLNTPSSAASTNARSVIVTNQGGTQLTILKTGQEAVLIGQIGSQNGLSSFTATRVFTNNDEVRRILADGSIVRRTGKRPGDNLGRDAQPSNNLDR